MSVHFDPTNPFDQAIARAAARERPDALVDAVAPLLPTMVAERLRRGWAAEILAAIPDGWCKVNGEWRRMGGFE